MNLKIKRSSSSVGFVAVTLFSVISSPAFAQDITCTSKECRGTDIMGNQILLRVNSDRTNPTQSYTARIGDTEIQVERKRSPLVSGGWFGPVLLQRPVTTIQGRVNGKPVNLFTESSGLTTGDAFGQPVTCAVNGFSVFSESCI